MTTRLRVLELFCGIGGCAAALGDHADVVAAVDINQVALSVYRHNFPHPVRNRAIESLPAQVYRECAADLWWMSPPCQPYTVRGRREDVRDPRAESLLTVIERIAQLRPRYVALENVPGFAGSRAHQRLRSVLDANGYHTLEQILCPTQLGVPNRRRRFYLLAGRVGELRSWTPGELPAAAEEPSGLRDGPPMPGERGPPWQFTVQQILDADPSDPLWVPDETWGRYRTAIHVLDPDDEDAESHCFASGYGQSIVRSGSYLGPPRGARRFSPGEILRLLCFPPGFRLPKSLTLRRAWKLVGNSLSVAAVRHVLAAIPELSPSVMGGAK